MVPVEGQAHPPRPLETTSRCFATWKPEPVALHPDQDADEILKSRADYLAVINPTGAKNS